MYLPELGEIQIYNYDSDIVEAKKRTGVLNSLLELFIQ
jgi:hypothetical protein